MPIKCITRCAVGLASKAFLNSGLCSMTVNGLPILLNALQDIQRHNGRGVITVSNHTSVLDDPLAWGILPAKCFVSSRTTRWALGASDIVFTNPVFSIFFRNGQVLETFRGKGIYQSSMDIAIAKLNQGGWVHIFPEGKVNQSQGYPVTNGIAHLPRFKWGIGRMLMETEITPVVIPMWLTGFESLMPEGRRIPFKYFPRIGVDLSVTIGDPLPLEDIEAGLVVLDPCQEENRRSSSGGQGKSSRMTVAGDTVENVDLEKDGVRSNVTAIVQNAVEILGRGVSGNLLRGIGKE